MLVAVVSVSPLSALGEERFFAEHATAAGKTSISEPPVGAEPVVAMPGDWTEFRGPRRDGVARGVEIEWGRRCCSRPTQRHAGSWAAFKPSRAKPGTTPAWHTAASTCETPRKWRVLI